MVWYQSESFLYKLIKTFVERNKKLEVFIRRSGKVGGSRNFSRRVYGTYRKLASEHFWRKRDDALENLLFAELSKQEDLLPHLNVVPKLNFKANQYIEMIDWLKCDVTETQII
ncbi:hypothetical protein AVEN_121764-1 [Araneus ventricosus]|uniref:Uncharacterized protein n=1 Tax=Araneus ventricosus TaxID=182803 RepID=A0A4Y2R0A9_ARAVE|nr:hypothetical protein AVEN_121764-1 [Araneus ventricosus]